CLSSPSPAERRAALEALATHVTTDLVALLEPLLGDPDPDVRTTAIERLVACRSSRAPQLLIEQLQKDPRTRGAALRALGELGDSTVIPYLIKAFDREGTRGRVAIVEALSSLPDPAVEPFLASQLGAADPKIRRAAVLALGTMTSANAARQLIP